ncbi:MAG: ribonuclease E/G [Frisingicoccus sp.]|nr:ribonuclease E/G [Frisingicoccus sp.]
MSVNISKEVVITNYKNHYLITLLENGKAKEFFLKSHDGIEIGDIFVGKVKNIVENIQAAFVEVSPGVIWYYSLKSNKNHLFVNKDKKKIHIGDEILVQIECGGIKQKAPVLTSKIQLQGKYLVFLGNHAFFGLSKKITSENVRNRMKNLGHQLIDSDPSNGIILRTNSAEVDESIVIEEYNALKANYNHIMANYSKRTCFSKLYSMPKDWLSYVHTPSSPDLRVVTDCEEVYKSIQECNCELYTDETYPLMKLKSLETQISRALSKNVWLRSGASLVIECTEALTAIDVNTSKTETRKKDEETFLQINLEAAREVCRQLRLRNISGIIIVDFINLSNKEYSDQLMAELRKMVKEDPVQTNVIDITPLGLVELTRKRTYKPFHEQFRESEDE